MANELSFRANSTPPFDIISYEEFSDIFINTRDISVLFPEPSDSFYSNIDNIKLNRHKKEDIMNVYYTQKHIDSLPIITEKIAFNAYYYPILKELIATQRGEYFLHKSSFTYQEIVNYVLHCFQGLDSDIYYELCTLNRNMLDVYRKNFTFEHRNINKYNFQYSEQQSKCNIIHNTLHTSLQRDLDKKFNTIKTQQLAIKELDSSSFDTLKSSLSSYSAIYKHLETNLSTVITNYFLTSKFNYSGGVQYHTLNSTFDAIQDLHNDIHFTSMFNYISCIGGIYGNHTGQIMKFSTFLDYHSTLSSYYSIIQSTNQQISTINCNIYSHFHSYVSTKYK